MEALVTVLAGIYLLLPIGLAVLVAGERRKRIALEARVARMEANAVRAAIAGALGAAAATGPQARAPAPALPLSPTLSPAEAGEREESAASEALPTTVALPPPLPPLPPQASRPAPFPPPPPPATSASPARPGIDWESLVGVRLFSWVAGVALLVAAVSFLRWSIENGWLGPAVRAAIGALVGVALVAGAETRRARAYAVTAQSLAGAGVAILFATIFAAHALWGLLPGAAAFALMVLVTAVAVAYAVRRAALVVALLGLAGGFATPILLSTGEDRPLALFSYLLLLNAGLAWVAHKRRWPFLGALSLGLTVLYQAGWVLRFLHVGNLLVGLAVFLVFPAFGFAVLALAARAGEEPHPVARWTAAVGAIPPVAFLLHAASGDLAARWPIVLGFAVLLAAGLLVVAAKQGPGWLHLAGVGGATLATFAVLAGRAPPPDAWPGALVPLLAVASVALGGPSFARRFGRVDLAKEARLATAAAPILLAPLASLVAGLPPGTDGRVSIASALLALGAALALVAATAAVAVERGDGWLLLASGVTAALPALGLADLFRLPGAPALAYGLGLGAIAVSAVAALLRARAAARIDTAGAVALLLAGQLAAALQFSPSAPFAAVLAVLCLLLGGLLAVAARTGRPAVALVAAVASFLAVAGSSWSAGPAALLVGALLPWSLQLAAPWLLLRRGDDSRLLPWAPALASALAILPLREALHELGLPWLVGPAVLFLAAGLVPQLILLLRAPDALRAERSRLVVAAGAILALVTAAIPLQLEKEWITVGWALLAAALAWLHRRVPHGGLLAWALGLAVAVTVRLAANPAVLHYHPRSGTPVWNFWLYAFGVPALALLAAARLLPREDDRLLPDLPGLRPVLAALGGLLLFLLLNVEIADAFSTGEWVLLRLRGTLAYDLALTIGWACFAIALLAAGIALRSRAARITSIALLALTVVKGFLLDLGNLSGLYRVASFVGLAVSLALVAVVLQKFVLADRPGRGGTAPVPGEVP